MQRNQLVDIVHDRIHQGCHHAGHAAAGGFFVVILAVRPEIYLLFLKGITIHARCVHLGEQGGIRTLAGILLTLDFHVGHLHGYVFAEGDSKGIVQRKDDLLIRTRHVVPVLGQGGYCQECAHRNHCKSLKTHI